MLNKILVAAFLLTAPLSYADLLYFNSSTYHDLEKYKDWCIYQDTLYSPGSEVDMSGQKKVCVIKDFYSPENRRLIWVDKDSKKTQAKSDIAVNVRRVLQ